MLFPEHQGGKAEGASNHWKKRSIGGKLLVMTEVEERLRTSRPNWVVHGQTVWQESCLRLGRVRCLKQTRSIFRHHRESERSSREKGVGRATVKRFCRRGTRAALAPGEDGPRKEQQQSKETKGSFAFHRHSGSPLDTVFVPVRSIIPASILLHFST